MEKKVSPRKASNIRSSTDEDIRVIHDWLVQQDADGVAGTFLCNWKLTLGKHGSGKLLVYGDPSSGEAIAYQWGGLVRPGILEVRADRRGQGIGQSMVEHMLAQAFENNEDLLSIECKPSSSIPFWRRMGFELIEGGNGSTYGCRVIRRVLDLPDHGEAVAVTIEWFPEGRKWNAGVSAVSTFSPKAVRTPDGQIHLGERVHWFDTLPSWSGGGVVLRIVVDGVERYFDKARYPSAAQIGLKDCSNGYYLDNVRPGS
jgi:GNAT superfamily N-acetyltransferase